MRLPLSLVPLLAACAAPPALDARVVPPVTAVATAPAAPGEPFDLRRLQLEARLLEAGEDDLAALGVVLAGGPLGVDVLDDPQARALTRLAGWVPYAQRGGERGPLVLRAGGEASLWFRCPGGAVGLTVDEVQLHRGAAAFDVGVTRWLIGPPGIDVNATRRLELVDGATALLRLGPEGPGRHLLLTARVHAAARDPGVLYFDDDE